MNWLKSTNPVFNWAACSLDLTVGAKLHNLLALPVSSVASMALSSLDSTKVLCTDPSHWGLICSEFNIFFRNHLLFLRELLNMK